MTQKKVCSSDWWVFLMADIITRLIYAIATAGAIILWGAYLDESLLHYPSFWIALVVATVLAAIFGPWLYRYDEHRGRGSLHDVKQKSEREP
ncbi:MAG: hypothetical protein L3K26_07030 [Candidatus Hydrogenedentes bacterium]|nr:hypothetical protein [Candidatus Hydrogenedentota bacterium]